jgi:hypothetical protein
MAKRAAFREQQRSKQQKQTTVGMKRMKNYMARAEGEEPRQCCRAMLWRRRTARCKEAEQQYSAEPMRVTTQRYAALQRCSAAAAAANVVLRGEKARHAGKNEAAHHGGWRCRAATRASAALRAALR